MIYKLFSQRQKEAECEEADVYQYETVSKKLRVQIQQILGDAIGRYYTPGYYDMNVPSNNNDAWAFNPSDRAAELIKILRQRGFWPDYVDKSMDQLLATLSSALPQLRNNAGAHGQGAEVKAIPRAFVEYALNLAAAKIILIGGIALDRR